MSIDVSKILLNQKIRVISYLNNKMFTIQPTPRKPLDLVGIIEYCTIKIHEDMEGIITDVVHLDELPFMNIIEIQQDKKYFATLIVSKDTSYMTLNPSQFKIWDVSST